MTMLKPNALSLLDDASNPFLRALAPKNPFAPVSDEVPADAPEGSYTYQLVQSGPAVPAEECEPRAPAVEVLIRWGTTVLHVAHLTPVRSFWVGEDESPGAKSDFFLPEEKLGARRLPLVLVDGADVDLIVPAGAAGTLTLAGGTARRVSEVIAAGEARPCAEIAGAHRLALPSGARAALDLNGMSFEISAVNAGKSAGRLRLSGEALPGQALSLLLHASLLAATAFFMPSLAMAKEDGIPDDQKYEMMALLAPEAIREPDQAADHATDTKPGEHGEAGQASPGEMGKAGSTASREVNRRFGVERQGPESALSRTEALQQARDFGMIGLLTSLSGSVGAPTSPWGQEIASGVDPVSGKGNIFGDTIGDAAGSNGLNLSGVGELGGENGVGVGVGRVGTIGHDFVDGGGHSIGLVHGRHQVRSPSMVRTGSLSASGRLPPEIIQRVVRQNFGRFKACYEGGLRQSPNLQGRVAVRFVIGRDGAVTRAENGGSDLPDAGVVSCVTRSFYGLSFPQPDAGIVTVTYPIVFSPAN